MQLPEQYRPHDWDEFVGQEKAVKRIDMIRKRGLAGNAIWITGASGTGKTSAAYLLAKEVACELTTTELNGRDLDVDTLDRIERSWNSLPLVPENCKRGYCWIVNESHNMRKSVCDKLLTMLDNGKIPSHVLFVFTTTNEGNDSFEDYADAKPLLSRMKRIPLTNQGLAEQFAKWVYDVATKEELIAPSKTVADCLKLVRKWQNNLRDTLNEVESGVLLD